MPLLDRFRLDAKIAVIIGALRGIGAASAAALAELGGDVVIAARSVETFAVVKDRVAGLGQRAVAVACDLSDLASMELVVDAATNELGALDIVVNNVGSALPGAS